MGRECSEELGVRWEGNIRMDLRDVGLEVMDWIHGSG
jgi:hypothetical protein